MNETQLDMTFNALADPTRRAILARLANGDASVGELAEPFEISLPAISRHLKVLEGANLIRRETDAQWRRCHLEPQSLKQASDWISQYRQFWEDHFDALSDYLDELKTNETKRGGSSAKKPKTKESKNGKSSNRKRTNGKSKNGT